ncbi:MAG: HAMP domain-containing histidine kinase [Deltaproteobacteria bacterium]|nr:HAMP domain-containing histidine kinase [Deltaproteobacteria bacterium]MBW2394364.1 HAMP domain-containing histidine kinase [Deltaproteobacteria bacterium]
MSRLSLRIYLAFLAVVLVFFLLSALLFRAVDRGSEARPLAELTAAAELLISPEEADPEKLQVRVERLAREFNSGLAVFDEHGRRLVEAGPLVPAPRVDEDSAHWLRGGFRGPPAAAVPLASGHWVVLRLAHGRGSGWHGLLALAAFALALGVGAYPVARGITGRLERLSTSVDAFGQGELTARAPIEGRDEVARLAESFNRTAQRIESLVEAQRTLLASASHELRSPLARLRIAVEILGGGADLSAERLSELRRQVAHDVAELDAGVEELLVVSRLDMLAPTAGYDQVDLLAMAAEEAARAEGEIEVVGPPDGAPALLGDARSLRHLLRNLITNAERHAPGCLVEIRIDPLADGPGVRVSVADRGPGIPEAQQQAVFDAFTRGNGAAGGLGLGLAIVRQVARHHGGEARAMGREGGGTLIQVDLPGRIETA